MGKGSNPRPFSVSQEEYNNRWDVIFSRDKISKEIEAEKTKQDTPHNPDKKDAKYNDNEG